MAFNEPVLLKRIPNDPDKRKLVTYYQYVKTGGYASLKKALEPKIKIIAPWRDWAFRSRRELIEYAEQHDIPVTATKAKPYSMDLNLFHVSYEGGILEDHWNAPPDEIFQMTVSPEQAPDKPQEIEIEYAGGDPVAVDGKKMSPATLLARLNRLGGAHGIGRGRKACRGCHPCRRPRASRLGLCKRGGYQEGAGGGR